MRLLVIVLVAALCSTASAFTLAPSSRILTGQTTTASFSLASKRVSSLSPASMSQQSSSISPATAKLIAALQAKNRLMATTTAATIDTTLTTDPSTSTGASTTAMHSTSQAQTAAPSQPSAGKSMKKILPLGAMLFFILFNYTILRDTKDVLVVTAPNSGAEIIPFLKTYVNLPSAIGFTVLYSYLSNKMPADKVFYMVMSAFIAFFGAFATIICKLSIIYLAVLS